MNKTDLYNLIKSPENKGGYYSKEKTIKTKFPEIYQDFVIKMNEFITKYPFKQLLWHYMNNDYSMSLGICPTCHNRSKFINCVIGYQKYCSIKCAMPEILNKSKETCLNKYGTEYALSNKDIRKKIISTNIDKYGFENVFQNKEIIEKSKETCKKKYGCEHYQSTDEFKTLISEASKSNYEKSSEKAKETCKEKYGCEHYQSTDEFRNHISTIFKNNYSESKIKAEQTCKEKYGCEHYQSTDEFKKTIRNKQNENIINKYDEVINIDDNNVICKCTNTQCELCKNKQFSIKKSIFFNRKRTNTELCDILLSKIKEDYGYSVSKEEKELVSFIHSIYDKQIIENDRSILNGKELDIYLPDKKIAIEFNGLYWHNELHKDKNYHIDKYNQCLKKGIQLIQIWEDDWNNKNEIVKNIIKSKICDTFIKIGARKCIIKEISHNDCYDFLNKYHLQGNINSSVRLGLYYNDELLEVATFGKLRKIMNSKSTNNEYELYRLCSKNGYTVIGGFSKMLSYFIKKYNPSNIITYASLDISSGDVYNKCGFKEISITKPGYFWIINNVRQNRFNYTKQKLISMGFDSSLSEDEIMHSLGYYKLYDSGNKKFILTIKKRENF